MPLDESCGMDYSIHVNAATLELLEALGFCFEPLSGQPLGRVGSRDQGPFAFLTGPMLGREDDSGTGEKRYWWAKPCNTAHEIGEASDLGLKGWRVSDTALGVTLKANLAKARCAPPLG